MLAQVGTVSAMNGTGTGIGEGRAGVGATD